MRLLALLALSIAAFAQAPLPSPANGGGGGGGGAPTDATYITQTANGSLSAEQALAALATGCLGSTATTGVVASRTITGTAGQIDVTNGNCSGNPTLSLDASVGDAATAVTTTCSGATPVFTATSNTVGIFNCALVATNVTSATLAGLNTGSLYVINITEPGGGGITFSSITGLTGFSGITTAYGQCSGADEITTILIEALSATTARAHSVSCSGVGNVVVKVGSGTKALDTDAIASEACDSQTLTVAGTLSTDLITIVPNASITAITGYEALTAGGLRVSVYPSANTVNIDVCNPTADSITPGAVVTLNVMVTR